MQTRKHALIITLCTLVTACGANNTFTTRAKQSSSTTEEPKTEIEKTSAVAEHSLAANAKKDVWHKGWDTLVTNNGTEFGPLPGNGGTPKTILATKSKNPGTVKMIDYWLRATGWTTMFGHSLAKYDRKNWRTDGVRWDTPTHWVPNTANGKASGGNMTLMTQFGSEIPNYWKGATPYAAQTDWIFHVNRDNGGIMEIFDRQHFGTNSDGTIKKSYAEVVSKSYYESLYWAPHFAFPVGTGTFQYSGPARFVGNNKQNFDGYSAVEVINRYDTFTVPPARNLSKDCPAAEFKDVIAVKHYQYWWDASTQTSRGDYMIIYMAKNIGWIYVLLNDSVVYNAQGQITKDAKHFLHLAPQGYVNQSGGWERICAHEFRDQQVKK